ncbi:hypothetical protein C5167_008000 [Papaver somniferum]|uniref:Protein kinase domain-containing protein n=1 Tax=Papaver somniferum TaxID=3469 RepID=A0A4Y7JT73_PAPSO|nr:hypothetical protein C5167_008000 [Papaver somniferum]
MGFYCKSSYSSYFHDLYPSIFFVIIIILSVFPSSTSSKSISFDFPKFSPNVSNLQFQNDTFWSSNNSIELTKNSKDAYRVGWATYSQPIQLWNATTGELADFSTHFSFVIACPDGGNCGDGLAFFLAPFGRKLPPDSSGGSLGLLERAVAGLNLTTTKVVAAEFDTWMNDGWDPSPDHVSINVNSMKSVATVPLENRSLKDGRKANAWVTYNSATNNLSVYLTYDDNPVFNGKSILYYIVDLSKVNKVAEIPKGKKDSKVGLLVGLLVGFLAVGCVLGFGLFLWLKKRGRSSRKNDAETANSDVNSEFEKGTGPKRFSYRELEYATNNFDEGGKLGEGGFGGVYKGFLSDMNLNIAVKRVSKGSKQGIKEYQPEVRIISNLRHRNLVQLIGWCHERDDLLLVYEFMPNRSLDNHLFRGELILTLEVSFGIVALEIACGKKAVDVSLGFLLVEWVWELYGIGRILEVADEKLNKNFDERQIKRLMVLGLWCAHPASKSRPSATQVINVLKFESPLPKLPLELPAPVYPLAIPSVTDFQSSDGLTDTLTGRHL